MNERLSEFEGRTIQFSKGSGKTTAVEILQGLKISEGGSGEIFEVAVRAGNRSRDFILKRFFGQTPKLQESAARDALRNYQLAKRAGLKVFSTYRLSEDRTSILMTNGNLGGHFCFGSNIHSPRALKVMGRKIPAIDNLDELISGLVAEAQKAAEHQLQLHHDTYFFLVNRENPRRADFVDGDMDNVEEFPTECVKYLLATNLYNALHALKNFVANNVVDDDRLTMATVQAAYRKAVQEMGLEEFRQWQLSNDV